MIKLFRTPSMILGFFMVLGGGLNSQAQIQKSGTVMGVIQIGDLEYSIINEDNTNNIYKTSIHGIDQLHEQEAVKLSFASSTNFDNCEVIGESNTEYIYAKLRPEDLTIPNYLSLNAPTQINDILYFDNKEHLEKYEDYMVDYCKEHPLTSTNELLDEIEASFNSFTSYRTFFNKKHNFLNGEFRPQQLLDIIKEDCINDEFLKTLFNNQKLIGVGDDVYFYSATGELVTVPKTSETGIEFLQNISTKQEEDYSAFQATDYWLHALFYKGQVIKDNTPMNVKGYHYINEEDEHGYFERYVSDVTLNSSCNPLYKSIQVPVYYEIHDSTGFDINYIDLNQANTTLSINWGDGSPQETISNYAGQDINHTYSTQSSFYPSTSITFDSPDGTITIEDGTNGDLKFDTEIACTNADAEEAENFLGPNPNFMMTCVVWVNNGNTFNRIGSKTLGMLKNPNGTWSPGFFSTVNAQVNGAFRDNNCNSHQTVTGTNTKHNDNFVQEQKTKLARNRSTVGTNDVFSHHNVVYGPINLNHQLSLNPCE